MTNFDDFEYRKENIPLNSDKKKLFFAELKKNFYTQAKQTGLYAEYLKKYDADSLEAFILEYAERKAYLTESYEYFLRVSDKTKEIKFRDEAMEVLKIIQQKKLFNLQLQWRAEQITLKGLTLCCDFDFWSYHIESCPVVPLVTRFDIDIAIKYLLDRGYGEFVQCYSNWQDYDSMMEKDEYGDNAMPDWYDYYDQMAGTGSLLLLPNIRGKKEDYYAEIGRADFRRKNAGKTKENQPSPVKNSRPELRYHNVEELTKFATQTETDKHFIELFNLYKVQISTSPAAGDNEIFYDIHSAIMILDEADRPVYVTGGLQWQEAIVKCADKYRSQLISESLEAVYDEYLMLTDLKIARGESADEIKKHYQQDSVVTVMTNFIFKGRELCGEPRDFNF